MISAPTIPVYLNVVKSKWRMFIIDHYYFFTDKSMVLLLEKIGFKVVNKRYVSKSVNVKIISA